MGEETELVEFGVSCSDTENSKRISLCSCHFPQNQMLQFRFQNGCYTLSHCEAGDSIPKLLASTMNDQQRERFIFYFVFFFFFGYAVVVGQYQNILSMSN